MNQEVWNSLMGATHRIGATSPFQKVEELTIQDEVCVWK